MISRQPGLGTEVYEVVLQRLMSLEIEPGARISIDRLARELGVSQTPIRLALGQLEVQGLVSKTHLVGYRATPQLTRKQFDDLCELRMLLEPAAAAKAAAALDGDGYARIAELAAAMSCPEAGDARNAYSAFAQKDAAFHALIAAASGNALFHEVIAQQRIHLHLFRLRYHAQATLEAVKEHNLILDAIRDRDAEAAAAAMRDHIVKAHERFVHVYGET